MVASMFDKYVEFIDSLINNENYDILDIINSERFRNFRTNNLITFGEAAMIDEKYTGNYGHFWRSAYNYPIENQIINNSDSEFKAVDVGLLTFNIVNNYVNNYVN